MDIYEIRQALNGGKTIYDLPLRVTYYARVSTDKDEQLHSLSAQVSYYHDFIRQCAGWTLIEGYVDEGISGTSVKKRENFLRMIEDARNHCFDFIITKEISRFSRSTLDSIQYTQELLRCGVGVLFQSDNINTLMPDSELRLTIMSSVAQEEVRKISERVRFGFKRAIESGVVLGSNRIWGYQKENGSLVIDEEEAAVVRRIFDLYANQRLGIRAISSCLAEQGITNSKGNPFSFSTIRGILSNPKYKGYYCGGKTTKIDYQMNTVKSFAPEAWVTYEDHEHVPPIVSEELWEKANLILDRRSAKQSAEDHTSYQNRYPYSGKILCGIHQEPYYRGVYRYQTGEKEVWQCREYVKNGRKGCQAPILYTEEIDNVLRISVADILVRKEEILHDLLHIYSSADGSGELEEKLEKCRAEMEEIMRRKDKLLDLSVEGRITDQEFGLRNDRFNETYEGLRVKQEELRSQQLQNQKMRDSIERLRGAVEQELTFENGFTAGVVDALLDHMEVKGTADKGMVEVHVYLNMGLDHQVYAIQRRRGKASLCSRIYI